MESKVYFICRTEILHKTAENTRYVCFFMQFFTVYATVYKARFGFYNGITRRRNCQVMSGNNDNIHLFVKKLYTAQTLKVFEKGV